MKKALMGTTALVAAAVTTGVAADEMMAEPISLSLGGNSHWGVAVSDNDATPDNDDISIANDVEIHFKGSTVLDSGIEIGVRVELEGEQSGSDQMDETYAYLSGSFGTLRIGNDDAASAQMGTSAPYATWFYGLNTPFWAYSPGISSAYEGSDNATWMSTYAGVDAGDSASFMYFSPVINGFQFGLSYAPEAGAEARNGPASQAEGNDVVSIGARYDGAFGDAGVAISAGYASQDDAAAGTTTEDMSVGVMVSMSDVSVGGSFRTTDYDAGGDELVQFDAGISYSMGNMSVSANIGAAEQGDMNLDAEFARLLANYNLGPGVNLAGALGNDSNNVTGNDSTFAGVALAISF